MRCIFRKNNPLAITAFFCTGFAAALPVSGLASGLPQANVPDGCGISFHETSLSSTELSLMQNSGFKVARIDLPWTSIEYSAGHYNFSYYDALVAQLTSIGVRPLLILDTNSPYYGSGAGPYNTTEQTGFANFAAAAAAHYASSNVIWEIWNEPNLTPWQPTSDPTYWRWTDNTNTYISLLKATVPAMRTADPNAVILGGVTSGVPQDYIEALLNSGALNGVNALSVHPYRNTTNPETVTADYDATRALIARYTPTGQTPLPIFSSEWGYATSLVSSQAQAAYLLRTYLIDLASGVNTSVFYDFVDNGTDSDPTNPNPENHYGVLTTAEVAKPSYTAVQSFTSQLNGYRFCHRMVGSSPLDYKLLFAGPSDVAIVEWAADDPTSDPNPPLPTITKIEPGNPSYNQLQLASCIQFAPDTLVATTGQPSLSITVKNPFSTAASVVVSNFGVNHTITAAANATATQSITLTPNTSPGIQPLDLTFTWNGTAVSGIVPPNATSASVFSVKTCPSGSNLVAYVTNTSQTAFSGRIVYYMNGSSTLASQSQTLTLAVGQSASVTFSGSAQAGAIQVVSNAGVVWGYANTEIDYSDTNWPANASGASPYNYQEYLNNAAQTPVTANVVADSTAPNGYGILMPYAAEPYNELDTLAGKSTDNIPLGATSMKVWVLSDGSGVIYKADFIDATDQSFTASGGNLDYPGWQLITLALDGSGGPHWGGANDGVPHGQCYWANWAIADGHGGYIPTHTGTLEFASPFYGYYSFGYGQHTLVNVNSNQALVVSAGSTSPGATLVQYSSNGTANGYWTLIPLGNGSYHIVNANSGQLINIPGASTTPGTQLIQYPDDGNTNSWWTLEPIGNGKYNIVSSYDGQYIEVAGSSTAAGAVVDQANPTGATNQQWYVY